MGLLSLDLLRCFSYMVQAHLAKDGTAHSGLSPPTTIPNAPSDMPTGQSDGGGCSSVEAPLPKGLYLVST